MMVCPQKRAKKPDKYLKEKELIKAVFVENKRRYGYRRITMELRNRGVVLNHKTVQKLMKECGLICAIRRKKYRSYKGEIVSYNISLHPTFQQTMDMLEKAFNKVPNNAKLILHSDQGWQYQMKRYQLKLKGLSPVQYRIQSLEVA